MKCVVVIVQEQIPNPFGSRLRSTDLCITEALHCKIIAGDQDDQHREFGVGCDVRPPRVSPELQRSAKTLFGGRQFTLPVDGVDLSGKMVQAKHHVNWIINS